MGWGGWWEEEREERKKEGRERGRAGTAADIVHFEELPSPAQNSSGFDSLTYEGGRNQNSCCSIIPSNTAEPFRLPANFLPTTPLLFSHPCPRSRADSSRAHPESVFLLSLHSQ